MAERDKPEAPIAAPPRPRGGPARAVAALTARLTRPLFAKRGFADGSIAAEWPNIAGAAIAAHSLPERISFPPGKRNRGTLHLTVAPGGFAVEIQHLEGPLLERVNSFFGYEAVNRLHLVQAPLPPAPAPAPPPPVLEPQEEREIHDLVAAVTDDVLRERLESLGQGVRKRRKTDR